MLALGEATVTEMTKTVRDNDPNKINIHQQYSLFRLRFIPERNKFLCRVDFFRDRTRTERNSKRRLNENTAIREESDFDIVMPARVIASKSLSFI